MPGYTRALFIAGVLLCLCVSRGVCQDHPVIGEPIQKTDPEYTEEARVVELEGTVVLRGTIGEDGLAHDLKVLESLGLGLDEKAVEAVQQWHFQPTVVSVQIPVDFRLSTKQSRWHLIRVQFGTPPGISRPVFTTALFPVGAGLGPEAMEEGLLVVAMGRLATAKVTFEVDEHGIPVHLQVPNSSEAVWGREATAVVAQWRFTPGTKNGIAVAVPCAIDLVWGERELNDPMLAQVRQTMDEQPRASSDVVPRSSAEPGKGAVRLRLVIGLDGRVRRAEMIDGDLSLTGAAAESVKQSAYRPTLLNGVPVDVTTETDVDVGPPH
jgi:TonB family protein